MASKAGKRRTFACTLQDKGKVINFQIASKINFFL
jgi:hypothetical protein